MSEPTNVVPVEPVQGQAPAAAETPAQAVSLDVTPGATPVVPTPAPAAPVEAPVAKFEPTGDVKMDIALAFFAKAGLKPEDEAVKLAQAGDFSLLKATLSAGAKAGWQEHVALAEASFTEATTKAKEVNDKTTAAVLGVFGGAEQWAEVQSWARENADDDEAAAINAMFKSGPLQAKAAAVYLKTVYEAAGKALTKTGVAAVADVRGVPEPRGTDALGPRDFAAAVSALVVKYGSRAVDNNIPEYQALVARRRAFRP